MPVTNDFHLMCKVCNVSCFHIIFSVTRFYKCICTFEISSEVFIFFLFIDLFKFLQNVKIIKVLLMSMYQYYCDLITKYFYFVL